MVEDGVQQQCQPGADEVTAVSPRAVVEHCFDADGTAALSTVYDVAAALGVDDQPVRLAVRRLAAAGTVVQVGRGRAGSLHLTPAARLHGALDLEYWAFAQRQDDGLEPWDGRWRLIGFSVPESRRADRDALRTTLAHLGAAALAPGLFVSPHDLVEALDAELPGRRVVTDLTTATATSVLHGGRDLRHQVDVLWPLDTVRAGYERLEREVAAWRARLDGPRAATGEDAVLETAARIALHSALDRALVPDPLLPPELLPAPWPGARARAAFSTLWASLDGGRPLSVVVR